LLAKCFAERLFDTLGNKNAEMDIYLAFPGIYFRSISTLFERVFL
jgi:hypothetical protein